MIPLRDDTERDRPSTLALGCALALLGLATAVLVSGSGAAAAALIALDAGFVWVLGAGAEASAGRVVFGISLLLGAAGGVALAVASGASGVGPIAAAGASGAALEAVVVLVLRRPGARVLSLVLVPWFGGFAEVRAAIWGAIWAGLVLVLAALGAFGG